MDKVILLSTKNEVLALKFWVSVQVIVCYFTQPQKSPKHVVLFAIYCVFWIIWKKIFLKEGRVKNCWS